MFIIKGIEFLITFDTTGTILQFDTQGTTL